MARRTSPELRPGVPFVVAIDQSTCGTGTMNGQLDAPWPRQRDDVIVAAPEEGPPGPQTELPPDSSEVSLDVEVRQRFDYDQLVVVHRVDSDRKWLHLICKVPPGPAAQVEILADIKKRFPQATDVWFTDWRGTITLITHRYPNAPGPAEKAP